MNIKLKIKKEDLIRKLGIKNGRDGKDGRNGKDGKDGKSMIGPKGERGERGRDGRDGKDGESVDEKKLFSKLLKEVLKHVPEQDTMNQVGYVTGGGMGDPNLLFNVDNISSQLNGSTKTFTIKPNRFIWDIRSSSAPWVFIPNTDYTVSGGSRETLTFTSQIDASTTQATIDFGHIRVWADSF